MEDRTDSHGFPRKEKNYVWKIAEIESHTGRLIMAEMAAFADA